MSDGVAPSKGAAKAARAIGEILCKSAGVTDAEMTSIIDRETKSPQMAALLSEGKQIVEGAVTHVTHGGPTIAEALEWRDRAERLLSELEVKPELSEKGKP